MSTGKRTPPHTADTRLRDARLQKALDSAPDAGQRPAPAIRAAILQQAHQAVARPPGMGRRFLRWLTGGGGHTHMPWGAGLAFTLFIMAGVGLLWMQPGYRELAQQEPPLTIAATEKTTAHMDSDDATASAASRSRVEESGALQASPPPAAAALATPPSQPASEPPGENLRQEAEKRARSPSIAPSEKPPPSRASRPMSEPDAEHRKIVIDPHDAAKMPAPTAESAAAPASAPVATVEALAPMPELPAMADALSAAPAPHEMRLPETQSDSHDVARRESAAVRQDAGSTAAAAKPAAKTAAEPAPLPLPVRSGDWRQDWTALRPVSTDSGSSTAIHRASATELAGLLNQLQPDAESPADAPAPSPSGVTLFGIIGPAIELQLLHEHHPVGRLALYPHYWQFIPNTGADAPPASRGRLTPGQWQDIQAELERLHLMDNAPSPN